MKNKYLGFPPGEQHGFRKSQHIQTSLDGELYFFGKVLGFQPADIKLDVSITLMVDIGCRYLSGFRN